MTKDSQQAKKENPEIVRLIEASPAQASYFVLAKIMMELKK